MRKRKTALGYNVEVEIDLDFATLVHSQRISKDRHFHYTPIKTRPAKEADMLKSRPVVVFISSILIAVLAISCTTTQEPVPESTPESTPTSSPDALPSFIISRIAFDPPAINSLKAGGRYEIFVDVTNTSQVRYEGLVPVGVLWSCANIGQGPTNLAAGPVFEPGQTQSTGRFSVSLSDQVGKCTFDFKIDRENILVEADENDSGKEWILEKDITN